MSLTRLPELAALRTAMGCPPRHPRQWGAPGEADCELVELDDGTWLATTVDAVSEEIQLGLYRDPVTMGWVTATSALSDLAACGARPIGLLFSATWGPGADRAAVFRGFLEAAAGTFLLGGDEGDGVATVLTAVGVGTCAHPLLRTGIVPGDVLCLTGPVGVGAALALRFVRGEDAEAFPERRYRPRARVDEGRALAPLAHAAMDTSDGVLTTLQTLAALNGVGMELRLGALDPGARAFCAARRLPEVLLWVAEHGDFELLCALPEDALPAAPVPVLPIGRATADPACTLALPDGRVAPLDLDALRAASWAAKHDPARLYAEMLAWARTL